MKSQKNTPDQMGLHPLADRAQIDELILANEKQIRFLSSKLIKNDYDHHELRKLQQKLQRLQAIRNEQLDFERNRHFLEELTREKMLKEKQLKQSLNATYQEQLSARQNTINNIERRRIEEERKMIEATREQMLREAAKDHEYNEMYRRRAMSDVQLKQKLKDFKKLQEQQEKEEFRKRYNMQNELGNPKSSSFKQFFDNFSGIQQKVQQRYEKTVMPVEKQRVEEKELLVNQGIRQMNARNQQAYVESLNKSLQNKQKLRDYLKSQMDERFLKERTLRDQTRQQGANQLQALQAIAEQQKNRLRRSKQDVGSPAQSESTNLIDAYKRRRQSDFQVGSDPRVHNPITNPIDFKFCYTNPYIVRQLGSVKQELSGESSLKLGNLALLGSSSLMK